MPAAFVFYFNICCASQTINTEFLNRRYSRIQDWKRFWIQQCSETEEGYFKSHKISKYWLRSIEAGSEDKNSDKKPCSQSQRIQFMGRALPVLRNCQSWELKPGLNKPFKSEKNFDTKFVQNQRKGLNTEEFSNPKLLTEYSIFSVTNSIGRRIFQQNYSRVLEPQKSQEKKSIERFWTKMFSN